jgi:hypothetical protein
VFDSIADWLQWHPVAGTAIAVAIVAVSTAVALAGACATVYFALFLRRLTRKKNVQSFIGQSIPAIRGGKGLGMELNFVEMEQATQEAVEQLHERLRKLEGAVTLLQEEVIDETDEESGAVDREKPTPRKGRRDD